MEEAIALLSGQLALGPPESRAGIRTVDIPGLLVSPVSASQDRAKTMTTPAADPAASPVLLPGFEYRRIDVEGGEADRIRRP